MKFDVLLHLYLYIFVVSCTTMDYLDIYHGRIALTYTKYH